MKNSRRMVEWEDYYRRKILEAQDSVRLYSGMMAIIPLLQTISEAGDIDPLLNEMEMRSHADARKKLTFWLHENCRIEKVEPILRVFDTYSV